jgi:hypothetical protein
VTEMEMTVLETVRLLGLDVQLALIAILLVLQAIERAAGCAWATLRAARPDRREAPRPRPVKIGKARHA